MGKTNASKPLIILFMFTWIRDHYYCSAKDLPCGSKLTVRYRMTFEAEWSDTDFPKQYPRVRPPAQWTKMIGRSHDENYHLWSKGLSADDGFKSFAESGNSDLIESKESQGFNGILDSFSSIPLKKGVENTSVDFFADSNHTKISTACKIVPSPDWFVGLDSFDLCKEDGKWVTDLRIPLQPMDAGTDQGFTFTSPNWASHPQEKIFTITSTFPAHRANSFYYPLLDELPPIGHIRLELLRSAKKHKIQRVVKHQREIAEEDKKPVSKIDREKLEEEMVLAGEPLPSQSSTISSIEAVRKKIAIVKKQPKFLTKSIQRDGINNRGGGGGEPILMKRRRASITRSKPKHRATKECMVSDWADWSPCSKTCGFGSQKRLRKVLREPVGKICPSLKQEKWCGSMRACNQRKSMFSWLKKDDDEAKSSSSSSSSATSSRRRIHHPNRGVGAAAAAATGGRRRRTHIPSSSTRRRRTHIPSSSSASRRSRGDRY